MNVQLTHLVENIHNVVVWLVVQRRVMVYKRTLWSHYEESINKNPIEVLKERTTVHM